MNRCTGEYIVRMRKCFSDLQGLIDLALIYFLKSNMFESL